MHTRKTLAQIVLLRHRGTIEECRAWVASGLGESNLDFLENSLREGYEFRHG